MNKGDLEEKEEDGKQRRELDNIFRRRKEDLEAIRDIWHVVKNFMKR